MGRVVREATEADTQYFTDIAQAFVEESPHYADIPFERDEYEVFFRYALESPDHLCLVCEEDGKLVAAMMAMVYSFPYSRLLQSADIGFYVDPSARGSRVALMMEKYYRDWALGKGARKIRLGVTTGDTKAGAFYERLGYTYVGSNYVLNQEN